MGAFEQDVKNTVGTAFAAKRVRHASLVMRIAGSRCNVLSSC